MAQIIVKGSTVSGQTLTGDFMSVLSGGVANSTTANNKGTLNVSNGGVANDITVNENGTLNVNSGAVLTGKLTATPNAHITVESGVTVKWDLTEVEAGGEALFSTIGDDLNNPDYFITVSADQLLGDYKLLGNATDFNKSITLTVVTPRLRKNSS